MISKAYRATRVNDVDWDRLARGNDGMGITLGIDVGKRDLWPVCRWADGRFERPWRAKNPDEIPALMALIRRAAAGRQLVVALESSGTYGDALRQALADAQLAVVRVSNKASHDYAEVFDGVPSQHDGKDAAVIAELAALGKARPWAYEAASDWEQELAYQVEWMVAHRRILATWQGRLEGLVARHWPEATRELKLSSVTLLRALAEYGDPKALAADPEAAARLAAWGGRLLASAKVRRLVADAGSSAGVRLGDWQRRWIRDCAGRALAARREAERARRRLCELAATNEVLRAQGAAVGVPTACVLWAGVGDPRKYHAAAAYRKAMGLNLTERSSGAYRGRLRISKRGDARARQWLYFAALRLVQRHGVRPWFEAKTAGDEGDARRVVVAVMRKLAVALYHVGARGEPFDPGRLFGDIGRGGDRPDRERGRRRGGRRGGESEVRGGIA
jgi:transposase